MQLNVRKADAGSACQAQRGDVGHSAVEREGCKEEVRKEGCAEAGLWGGATDGTGMQDASILWASIAWMAVDLIDETSLFSPGVAT